MLLALTATLALAEDPAPEPSVAAPAADPAASAAPADPTAPAADPAASTESTIPATAPAAPVPPPAEAPAASDAPAAPAEPCPTDPVATLPAGCTPAKPDLSAAVEAPTISKRQLRLFKPSPYHLPANPRQQIDFTAYTLEFGEVKLGAVTMTVGILPHVHVGTSVPLDVLGIANVHAKVHITEKGIWDVAPLVAYYVLPRQDFSATYLSAGGIASIQIVEPWSVHFGGSWSKGSMDGDLDLTDPLGLLWFLDTAAAGDPTLAGDLLQVETVTGRVASDIRFNRRDSIVLQAEAVLWTKVERADELWLPEFMGLEEALEADGFVPVADAAVASIAWQFAWEHWEVRLGAGISSVPAAWLLQSTEISYRFGGRSRVREKRMRETWEKNKDEMKDGLDKPGK